MDFDYTQFPKDHFDIIWASPPCTCYSSLQDSWLGRMRKGKIYTKDVQEAEMKEDDKLVLKVFEIIKYFNCQWFIENPASSKMKDRPCMKDVPNYLVDYCRYSDWGYRKRTRVWTNRKDFTPLLCDGTGTCGNMIDSHHRKRIGTNEHGKKPRGSGTTQNERYRIPETLILALFL